MSELGYLWDRSHQFTGRVPTTPEMIQALREHLTTEHRRELITSVSATLAENRRELARLNREMAALRPRFLLYLRKKALWKNDLLKQLNQEGILV